MEESIYLHLTLHEPGTMDSDHSTIYDALHAAYPNSTGSGLKRKGYDLYLRIDGIPAITASQVDEFIRIASPARWSVLSPDAFWKIASRS